MSHILPVGIHGQKVQIIAMGGNCVRDYKHTGGKLRSIILKKYEHEMLSTNWKCVQDNNEQKINNIYIDNSNFYHGVRKIKLARINNQ